MASQPQTESNAFYGSTATVDALLAGCHALPETSGESDDPLDILVNLTRHGRIDPWNINIVAVADEYLKAIAERKQPSDDNDGKSDLKGTGKTLLYLAILLRMKSDQLAGQDYLTPIDNPDDGYLEDDDGLWGEENQLVMDTDWVKQMVPYENLESMIERRSSTKARRNRPVTLNDLIAELQRFEEADTSERFARQAKQRDRVRDVSRLTAKQIENLAHEEFIEENIIKLQGLLGQLLHGEGDKVTLQQLIVEGGLDKISAYLALLFLSARSEVDLHQEILYGDLHITRQTGRPNPTEDSAPQPV